jgi:hypothetical protein
MSYQSQVSEIHNFLCETPGLVDINDVEAKLQKLGVFSLNALITIDPLDLVAAGISREDILLVREHGIRKMKEMGPLCMDLLHWLKDKGLEPQYLDKFKGISLNNLDYLRKSDLYSSLGIPLVEANRLWMILPHTHPFKYGGDTSSSSFLANDNESELIGTTEMSPFRIVPRLETFERLRNSVDENQSSIKVSFVGDTAAGKSFIITHLLPFDDRVRSRKGPMIAPPGQTESTSGNVCIYRTNIKYSSFFLLDFEGVQGTYPRRLREQWGKAWNILQLQTQELSRMQQERAELVNEVFPQLAYLLSNIIVFVTRQPPHHTKAMENLISFAQASAKNTGSGEKPLLIIIQNFADQELQLPDKDTAYLINNTTKLFHEYVLNRNSMAKEALKHYRDIYFVKLPSWYMDALLFDRQILSLQERFLNYVQTLNRESWLTKNLWTDRLWLRFALKLANNFHLKTKALNMPALLSSLMRPPHGKYARILKFWQIVWSPPVVGVVSTRKELEDRWIQCYDLTLRRYSFLIFDELQSFLEGSFASHLQEEYMKKILDEACKVFTVVLLHFSPCVYERNKFICAIPKGFHCTGHFDSSSGDFEPPNFPKNLQNTLNAYLMECFKMDPTTRQWKKLFLLSEAIRDYKININSMTELRSFCVFCLNKFKPQSKLCLTSCGHLVCGECLTLLPQLFCPLHSKQFICIDYKVKPPRHCGVRILTIDGGGALRGMIPIKILLAMERLSGYKIHQLFDMIIGSGVGGIVTIAVGVKRVDLERFEKEFYEYLQRIFRTNPFAKLSPIFKHKFSANSLIEETKRMFGQTLLSETMQSLESPVCAVVTFQRSTTFSGAALISNYVHTQGVVEIKEGNNSNKKSKGRKLRFDATVWQAAAATFSAPSYFPPIKIGDSEFFDGGLAANNPSIYGLQEARLLWPERRIDCLVSVGTGFIASNPTKGDGRLIWGRQVRNLIEETLRIAELVSTDCERESIYYRRLSPNVKETLLFDCVDHEYLELLSNATNKYLLEIDIKDVCCQLLANLLYIDEVLPENVQRPTQIIVRSRVTPFRFPKEIGQWSLVCECTTDNTILAKVVLCEFDNSVNVVNKGVIAIIYINRFQPQAQFKISMKVNNKNTYPISGCTDFCLNDLIAQ